MMRWIVAMLLVLSLVAAPGVAAADEDVVFTNEDVDAHTVDLIADGGGKVNFRVDEAALSGPASFVSVRLACACAPAMDVFLTDRGSFWSASLPVFTPDLVKGTWTATLLAENGMGDSVAQDIKGRTLNVVAADTAKPTIGGIAEGQNVQLGPGQAVDSVVVQDELIWKVTMNTTWMQEPHVLPFPYGMPTAVFRTGQQDVELKAYDRAGNVENRTFTVFADAIPPAMDLDLGALYHGVNNTVDINVTEHSAFEVNVSLDGLFWTHGGVGTGQGQTVSLTISPGQLGNATLNVTIQDAFGSTASSEHPVEVLQATTDGVLASARQVNRPLAGELLEIELTGRQDSAVVPIMFDVWLADEHIGQVEVPKAGSVTKSWEFLAQPGARTQTLRMVPPVEVAELDDADNSVPLPIEVFLGRVTHGDAVFYIRGDARGLPTVAVDSADETHPLRLQTLDGRSVYAFEANGTSLYWDPATSTTEIPVPEPVNPRENKGIPSIPVLLLLGLLAALAAVRRR